MAFSTVSVRGCSACGMDHPNMQVVPIRKENQSLLDATGYFICPVFKDTVYIKELEDDDRPV